VNKNVRWKLILILGVVALSVWAFYPPSQKVSLGLDLKGGVHLVMRVRTDEALRIETETTVERLRESLSRAAIQYSSLMVTSPTEFVAEGVQNPQAFRQAAVEVDTVFGRTPGAGGRETYTMRPNIATQLREEAVNQALQTIERRVNELGVAEPIVARQGAADQILVQLPGVTDVARAKEIIRNTAILELKIVEQGPFPSEDAARQAYNNAVPPDLMIVAGSNDVAGTGGGTPTTVYYVVRRVAPVTGRDLRTARTSLDQNNLPAVGFTLSQDGARRFGQLTEQNVGRSLAIILDNRVFSAPTIQSRITDEGQITGAFTQQEAGDLSLVLRSGALPASLDFLEERTVGPTLGRESIEAGVMASIGGLLLVVLFLLFYYKLTGLNAVISIVVNLVILLGMMAYLGATMTLPGIAGFILTIGMGVDSNVLIFERIKEELATAKGVRAAVNAGFDRVWWTIVDTHVASLIAAMFLFQFGTGPIRGFATTLTIGLLSNVFTAVFVSRTVFELVLARRPQHAQAQTLSI
jgi:preprotein translocase subunit SecD